MKVQIEISEKIFNLAIAQMIAKFDSKEDEENLNKIKECFGENIVEIDPELLGEDSFQLQLGLSYVAIAKLADEIDKGEDTVNDLK